MILRHKNDRENKLIVERLIDGFPMKMYITDEGYHDESNFDIWMLFQPWAQPFHFLPPGNPVIQMDVRNCEDQYAHTKRFLQQIDNKFDLVRSFAKG